MAEPLKNLFTPENIQGMAWHFERQWSGFPVALFVASATENFEHLALKQRSNQIKNAMLRCLPQDYEKAAGIMLASLGRELGDDLSAGNVDEAGISGWSVMPMADYVGQQGFDHFDLSMTLFKAMTKRASSEFGLRYFLTAAPEKTLAVLHDWVCDKNQHVRRLVSEGTRPRLPWGMRLPVFIENPRPVIELLECLKDDEQAYVRRSVANNLNDIAKDHPDIVADIAERWLDNTCERRKKLVNHACRTLVKNAHEKTLSALGFDKPKMLDAELSILTPVLEFEGCLQFSFAIHSTAEYEQSLVIDYIIHHQKANGTTSPKVFKWRVTTLNAKESLVLNKKHAIRRITTRVYYPGTHKLEIMVNGVILATGEFQLMMH